MPFPININDDCLMTTKKTMTTNAGTPVAENQNVQTAGPHGPMLMQNVWYMEKLAHFTRERIPERVVHAKGSAAYGTFTVTKDITKYTKASIFSEVGKQTDLFRTLFDRCRRARRCRYRARCARFCDQILHRRR